MRRGGLDRVGIHGTVIATLCGPDGRVKQRLVVKNLLTNEGDQYYGDAGAALHANATVTAPTAVKGMILSTQTTAAAKSGAGSYISTGYITGSNNGIDAGFPTSTKPASARRITWETTWAAGDATNAAIGSVALVNPTTFSDAAAAEADTIAYAVFTSTINKAAGDSLIVTWYHDILGA